jgi:chromate transporter
VDKGSNPSEREMLAVWARIGIASFGGGVATLGLIRQELVSKREWLTEEQFLRDWSLCQLAPGINLIAITILIGRRMGGPLSVAVALAGLLLPSAAATVLLTAVYAYFSNSPFTVAARRGIIPAVAGVGLATAWGMLVPIGKRHLAKGTFTSAFYGALLAACFLAQRVYHVSPVEIVLAAGMSGALFNFVLAKTRAEAR